MIQLLFLAVLAITEPSAGSTENKLPAEAEQALRAPGKVVLYSLEPWERPAKGDKTLHYFKVLGRTELDRQQGATAIAEFKSAVAGWDGMRAACFDPRHALRVTAKAHTYDFLLCYACHLLSVYRDNKLLATVGAAGSPQALNELLSAARIPISKTDSEEDRAAQAKAIEDAEARWLNAMPQSIRPLWGDTLWTELSPNVEPLRAALTQEFPDVRQRILALFAWYGSGQGPWSGYLGYEDVAETLLLDYPTPDLIAAAETEALTEPQLEGAARLFGGWTFGQNRPDDRKALPAALKKKLLDHSLESTDDDKLRRARSVFGR